MATWGALAIMFLAPLAGGILLAFLQLAAYRLSRRSEDDTPSFPILFARGLLAVFILAAVLAVTLRWLPS